MKKIKYIFADMDGVVTDGTVRIDEHGKESKAICFRDLDAIGIGRSAGIEFAFVTGEDTPIAHFMAKRFGVDTAVFGAKDKKAAVEGLLARLGVTAEEICYIGDSARDVPAIELARIGVTVQDGALAARRAADLVTECRGGTGALLELVETILERREL
ncbi:HAD family hydrolase [Selenomonas noxia]